jgi:hypothetical protein
MMMIEKARAEATTRKTPFRRSGIGRDSRIGRDGGTRRMIWGFLGSCFTIHTARITPKFLAVRQGGRRQALRSQDLAARRRARARAVPEL